MAYKEFRKQLDAVLRTKDPAAVRQFLVAHEQWSESEEAPIDAERAMWLMIAGSPTLEELHPEAQTWLIGHGYQSEAAILFEQKPAPPKGGKAAQKSPAPQSGARGAPGGAASKTSAAFGDQPKRGKNQPPRSSKSG